MLKSWHVFANKQRIFSNPPTGNLFFVNLTSKSTSESGMTGTLTYKISKCLQRLILILCFDRLRGMG